MPNINQLTVRAFHLLESGSRLNLESSVAIENVTAHAQVARTFGSESA
jgi:hypothetical protein